MIFSKLNGLGNDFVITDDRENKYTENLDEMARKLCHRRTGIGADGLVFVRKSETCDVRMQIFNSDGSEAEMCGNGVRCFAKYVYDKGIFKHERMSVETLAGPMIIDLTVKDGVAVAAKVDMGVPETRREFIPVVGTGECQLEKLAAVDKEFTFSTILLGVPHTVVFMDHLPTAEEVFKYGSVIEPMTSLFPRKTNVNFTHVLDDHTIEVRTYERGVENETLACGTGATAAAIVTNFVLQRRTAHFAVSVPGGELAVRFSHEPETQTYTDICLTGPARRVFGGVFDSENF